MNALRDAMRVTRYRLVLCLLDNATGTANLRYVDEDEEVEDELRRIACWGVVDTMDNSRVAGGTYGEMKEKLAEVRGLVRPRPTTLEPAMVTVYAGGGKGSPETVSLHDGVTADFLRNAALMLNASADLMDRTGIKVPLREDNERE